MASRSPFQPEMLCVLQHLSSYLFTYLFICDSCYRKQQRKESAVHHYVSRRVKTGVHLTFGTSYPHLEPRQSWKLGGNPKLTVH